MSHNAHQLDGRIDFIIFVHQRLLELINNEHFRRWNENITSNTMITQTLSMPVNFGFFGRKKANIYQKITFRMESERRREQTVVDAAKVISLWICGIWVTEFWLN